MKAAGYTNPMRNMERRLAPDYENREFRDPGLRSTHASSGLGTLRHTMPHLQRLTATRLQGGGMLDPVNQIYAASRPNLYNPDPMHRRVLDALRQSASSFRSPQFTAAPFSSAQFSYADGGEAEDSEAQDFDPQAFEGQHPDDQDVMNPEDQQSGGDNDLREIVMEAMAALEGQHPDPEEAIAHFIDTFGPRALADLQQMVEAKHQSIQRGDDEEDEEDEDEEQEPPEDDMANAPAPQAAAPPEEEDELAGAGGGLLEGQGTGQSDEIEGETPSGRPVLLSDGEYVIDAPTVAALGDGSTSAGARRLDALRKQIRRDAWGHDKQAKPMSKGGRALVLRLP